MKFNTQISNTASDNFYLLSCWLVTVGALLDAIAVKSLDGAALIIEQTNNIYNTVLSKTNSVNLYTLVT